MTRYVGGPSDVVSSLGVTILCVFPLKLELYSLEPLNIWYRLTWQIEDSVFSVMKFNEQVMRLDVPVRSEVLLGLVSLGSEWDFDPWDRRRHTLDELLTHSTRPEKRTSLTFRSWDFKRVEPLGLLRGPWTQEEGVLSSLKVYSNLVLLSLIVIDLLSSKFLL